MIPGGVAVRNTQIDTLIHTTKHTMTITTFVFVMMVWVDYINAFSRGRFSRILAGGHGRQYVVCSALGAVPGCLGAFMNVSFYQGKEEIPLSTNSQLSFSATTAVHSRTPNHPAENSAHKMEPGTWEAPEWQELIRPTLADEATRRAYD